MAENFRNFDPTSTRDEDLPIDLDHLIPYSKFGCDWRSQSSLIAFDDRDENFRWHRKAIGNSLGNYRWLDAATNRSRGAREIEPLEKKGDFVRDPDSWNLLISTSPWNTTQAAEFQKLIDLRTLAIYESLLLDGRLGDLIPDQKLSHQSGH